MSCDISNFIYVIICPTCGEEYIGETGLNNTKLRDRVRVYWQYISNWSKTSIFAASTIMQYWLDNTIVIISISDNVTDYLLDERDK